MTDNDLAIVHIERRLAALERHAKSTRDELTALSRAVQRAVARLVPEDENDCREAQDNTPSLGPFAK